MGQDEDNRAASLPDDLLVDILGHLEPRWLAVSRCVCKAWQATIDAHRLLRTDMLPLRLDGIFLYFTYHKFPEFFSRPFSHVSGKMDFLPSANEYMEDDQCEVQDHCNGLLLLQDPDTEIPNYVVNPATRRWDPLPKPRVMGVTRSGKAYLVYDPTVSLHYQVFMIPYFPYKRDGHLGPLPKESECPPAICTMLVFSSKTRCWEPKPFDREGDALGTVAEMRTRRNYTSSCSWWWVRRRAVYWRATLYVHCEGNFLTRISLSNGMFRAIELPEGAISSRYATTYLGRSEKGVYFASIDNDRLRVWVLNDSCGKIEWMLTHEHGIVLPRRHEFGRSVVHGPWVLKDTNYNFFWRHMPYAYRDEEDVLDEWEFDWSSDDDDDEVVANRDMAEECYHGDILILGFHPFKEIIFLLLAGKIKTPLAYHYNSLKAEVLGNAEPTGYYQYFTLPNDARTVEGFPYVPCWLEEFPTNTTQPRSS